MAFLVSLQALQETLLNMDKLNYEGKLDNGFHNGFENIDGEDGSLNVSLDGESVGGVLEKAIIASLSHLVKEIEIKLRDRGGGYNVQLNMVYVAKCPIRFVAEHI